MRKAFLVVSILFVIFVVQGIYALFEVQKLHTQAIATNAGRMNALKERLFLQESRLRVANETQGRVLDILNESLRNATRLEEIQAERISMLEERLRLVQDRLDGKEGHHDLKPAPVLASR